MLNKFIDNLIAITLVTIIAVIGAFLIVGFTYLLSLLPWFISIPLTMVVWAALIAFFD